jgi:hypothetical protein
VLFHEAGQKVARAGVSGQACLLELGGQVPDDRFVGGEQRTQVRDHRLRALVRDPGLELPA